MVPRTPTNHERSQRVAEAKGLVRNDGSLESPANHENSRNEHVLKNKSAREGGYSKRSALTGLTRVARLAGIQQASKTAASRSAATAA